jgi:Transmembrane exosortase (Exosortase_EpsH)
MYRVIRLSPSWTQRMQMRLAHHVGKIVGKVARIAAKRAARPAASLVARIDRLPSMCWPLLVALAAWPSVVWTGRRLIDSAGDRLGIVALCALMLALWHARLRFDRPPRVALLCIAATLVFATNLAPDALPDALRALIAACAVTTALASVADRDETIAPYAGMLLLALPLMASIDFHAGYPLRLLTAESSRWLLSLADWEVARVGSTVTVDGHFVQAAATSSGAHLAWVGAFIACVVAWMLRVPSVALVMRLPLIAVATLVVNIARNTLLIAADASQVQMTDAMLAAIDLSAGAVVATIAALMLVKARRPKRDDGRGMYAALFPIGPAASLRIALVALLVIAASLPLIDEAVRSPLVDRSNAVATRDR